jgi:4-amino-4-deoxy-L-arabinose transferase-like glycosyltransferase
LFFPSFKQGFSQDDYKNLYLSQNIKQVGEAFNIFKQAEYPFYRPLSTQLYFFTAKQIFGFNPLGYHVVNFIIYVFNMLLVYKLIKELTKSKNAAVAGMIFFGINVTHFAPLYSPAYVQELLLVFFTLLTVIFYLKKSLAATLLFFIFALMSKETAVIVPGILALVGLYVNGLSRIKKIIIYLLPFALILGIYLLGHFLFYGLPESASYHLVFGKQNLQITFWYFAWAFSVPNILIDFLLPGLKINPLFFQIAGINGYLTLILFPLLMAYFCFLSAVCAKRQMIMLGFFWFLMGILPLIFFPFHKLAVEQSVSLVGMAIFVGHVFSQCVKKSRLMKAAAIIFMTLYIVFAANSILLAQKSHWLIRSEIVARNTMDFLKNKYPRLEKNKILYFSNGKVKIAAFGSSRQVFQALGEGKGIDLLYGRKITIYFEGVNPLPKKLLQDKNVVMIDAAKLLGY